MNTCDCVCSLYLPLPLPRPPYVALSGPPSLCPSGSLSLSLSLFVSLLPYISSVDFPSEAKVEWLWLAVSSQGRRATIGMHL